MTTSEPTTNAKCWCCNGTVFKSADDGVASHYICQSCNSLNVIGGGGGGASEPTTGEIVRALREEAKMELGGQAATIHLTTIQNAIDRLESQERKIAVMRGDNFDATSVINVLAYLDTVMGMISCADGIKDLIVSMQGTTEELTARAEQAERERDAFIDKIRGQCSECKYEPLTSSDEPCASCHTKNGYPNWEWRGLPQDGEGK